MPPSACGCTALYSVLWQLGGILGAALGFVNPLGLAALLNALHVQQELVALLWKKANIPAFTAGY